MSSRAQAQSLKGEELVVTDAFIQSARFTPQQQAPMSSQLEIIITPQTFLELTTMVTSLLMAILLPRISPPMTT